MIQFEKISNWFEWTFRRSPWYSKHNRKNVDNHLASLVIVKTVEWMLLLHRIRTIL